MTDVEDTLKLVEARLFVVEVFTLPI